LGIATVCFSCDHVDIKARRQHEPTLVILTRTVRISQKLWTLLVGLEAKLLIETTVTRL